MDERFAAYPIADAKIRAFEPQEVLDPTVVLGKIKLGLAGYEPQRKVLLVHPTFVEVPEEDRQALMRTMGEVLRQASQVYVRLMSESVTLVNATVQGEIYCDGEPLSRAVWMAQARQQGELAL